MLTALFLSAFLAAGPPSRASAGSEIRGRVVRIDGSPASGVAVIVRRSVEEAELAFRRDAGKEREQVGRTTSAADGRFAIRLASGGYEVELTGDGLASGRIDVQIDAGSTEDLEDISLPPAKPLSGSVLDAAGRPAAGAWVIITSESHDDDDSSVRLTTAARTDAAGRFTAPAAAQPVFGIEAIAAGAPLHASFRFGRRVTRPETTIRLEVGRRITGRALRPDGSAAAGILVTGSGHAVRTEKDGTFSLDGAEKNAVSVVASDGDLRGAVLAPREKGGPTAVELRLSPSARLSGRIVDAISRRPIARTEVSLRSLGKRSFTDRRGLFETSGLPPGVVSISAGKRGYATATLPSVDLVRSAPNRVEIALVPMAMIEGRVIDEKKLPVAGARLETATAGGSGWARRGGESVTGRSRKDGSFTIFADARAEIGLAVSAEGFAPAAVQGLRVAPGGRKNGIIVTLAKGISAAGRIVDQSGKPVGGAKIEYDADEPGRGRRFSRSRGDGSEPPFVVSNGVGRFLIEHLPAGTYRLEVSHVSHASKTVSGVHVAAGAPPIPDIVLAAGAAIEGVVRESAGQAIPAADVSAHGMGIDESTETGPDGSFRLTTFPAGARPGLFVIAQGYTTAMRTVEAPSSGVVVTLSSNGILRGRVEDAATQQPVSTFTINAGSSGQRRGGIARTTAPEAFESPDGSFEIHQLPGKWTLTASAPGYVDATIGDVDLAPGETKENLNFSLKTGAQIDGLVLDDATSAPVAGAVVEWSPNGPSTMPRLPGGGYNLDERPANRDRRRRRLSSERPSRK